jgi:hypothetical protein
VLQIFKDHALVIAGALEGVTVLGVTISGSASTFLKVVINRIMETSTHSQANQSPYRV